MYCNVFYLLFHLFINQSSHFHLILFLSKCASVRFFVYLFVCLFFNTSVVILADGVDCWIDHRESAIFGNIFKN